MAEQISWNMVNDEETPMNTKETMNIRDGIYAARCTNVTQRGSMITVEFELCGHRTPFSKSWNYNANKEFHDVFREIMGIETVGLKEAIGRICFIELRRGDWHFVCPEWMEMAANIYNSNEAIFDEIVRRVNSQKGVDE